MINPIIQKAYENIDPSSAVAKQIWETLSDTERKTEVFSEERIDEEWSEQDVSRQEETAIEPEYEIEEETQEAVETAPVERRSASHTPRHEERVKKAKGSGKSPKAAVIAIVLVLLVALGVVAVLVFGGKDKPQNAVVDSPLATPAGVESENLSSALEYNGPDWAMEKLDNMQKAMAEWDAYKSEKMNAYRTANLPNLTDFLTEAEAYDGTDVDKIDDNTYTFYHWRYMENSKNSSVSPVTGESIPELLQVLDFDNPVTVDGAEYERYLVYVDMVSSSYGDYNFIYNVYDAQEAAKLEEIAKKYSLTLRKNDETIKGYGENSDSELQTMLAEAVGKGNVYATEPDFDHFFYYDNGSFQSYASVDLSDGRRMYTSVCNTVYNEMADGREAGSFTVEDAEKMTTRSYTAADGTELSIMQNDTQAIVYAYLDNSCVVMDMNINPWRKDPESDDDAKVRSGKEETNFKLTDEVINAAADAINFSNIGK